MSKPAEKGSTDKKIDLSENKLSREEVKAQREAKKAAKLAKKKGKDDTNSGEAVPKDNKSQSKDANKAVGDAKAPASAKSNKGPAKEPSSPGKADAKKPTNANEKNKQTNQKVDRAPQKQPTKPAQQKQSAKPNNGNETSKPEPAKTEIIPATPRTKQKKYKAKLFNHLNGDTKAHKLFINNTAVHPSIIRVGEQYLNRSVTGSNARCIAFLYAIRTIIQDYVTPPNQEFSRGLEANIKNYVDYLQNFRPLAVSIINAYKYIKYILTQLPTNSTDSKLKENLCELIDAYIRDQIDKAAEAISSTVQEKICNGDVILTFGCSSLINHILEEAHRRNVDFRVIIVDCGPFLEGQELLRRLISKGISCTCVLINAIGFIMPEVTKVLLGAHALLANGYVMARTGTAQIALVARSFNVPALVCCETHKFSERVQTDAIVFNELGNPEDIVKESNIKEKRLANWQSFQKLYPLNLIYDITPPELVSAVVTEVAILPCTSVPVILRIRPTEILY